MGGILNKLLSILFLAFLYSDNTAEVMLTDSQWNDIGGEYPFTTETVYVQVSDLDESGQLVVEFTSNSDGDIEPIVLEEVEAGMFRGQISVEVVSYERLSSQQESEFLPLKIDQLQSLHPDWSKRKLESKARSELGQESLERYYAMTPGSRNDGILQIRPSDMIQVSYLDMLNDFGNEQIITDSAVFNGQSGNVSGVWTIENSPYVVTGDIQMGWNEQLTIEPGVEVLFTENTSFYVQGSLNAVGQEGAEISFKSASDGQLWNNFQVDGGYGTLSHVQIESVEEIYMSLYSELSSEEQEQLCEFNINNSIINYSGSMQMSNYGSQCNISIKETSITGQTNEYVIAVDGGGEEGNILLQDLIFSGSENSNYGIYISNHDDVTISGCTISGFYEEGLYIYDSSVMVENSTITDNGTGIFVNESSSSIFNNNNIYSNNQYDVRIDDNMNGEPIDFKSNYWGEETTSLMNEGNNPQNIEKFYDFFDNNSISMINYADWLNSESNGTSGDLNQDSAINIYDIMILLHLMLNGLYSDIGDIDFNGTIDIIDCLLLVNIILER